MIVDVAVHVVFSLKYWFLSLKISALIKGNEDWNLEKWTNLLKTTMRKIRVVGNPQILGENQFRSAGKIKKAPGCGSHVQVIRNQDSSIFCFRFRSTKNSAWQSWAFEPLFSPLRHWCMWPNTWAQN